jgi:arabinosaccharide transport system substrate-binding protein
MALGSRSWPEFPLGRAALAMGVTMVASALALLFSAGGRSAPRPDLVYATYSPEHAAAYGPVIARFEKQYGVTVQVQVVDVKAMADRLQAAMQVGAAVPDMVELLNGTLGTFTQGPIGDVKLVDLTDRVAGDDLYRRVVRSRFAVWTDRGHVFALPHDLHPVMLAYRRDLVAALGIDVSQLTTWDAFAAVGRTLRDRHLPGDAVARRYMMDLPYDGGDAIKVLLLQRGGGLFDTAGRVTFDSDIAVDTVCWYVRQTRGDNPVGYGCGGGQALARAMLDGLCLFYMCPDWRARQFELDTPSLAGKMALMPMPAWEPGGRRTSTLGGTGLAITAGCKNVDLAWRLAMALYYDPAQVAARYPETEILPPLRAAWTYPELAVPNPFYSDQRIGLAYAALGPDVPEEHGSAYTGAANAKMSEAFSNAALYYATHGEAGLRPYTAGELKRCADQVRRIMRHNVFLNPSSADQP